MRAYALSALTMLALATSPVALLPAQEPAPPVAVGATVRLVDQPTGAWRQGRLAALDGDRLVLTRAARGGYRAAADTVDAGAVRRIEVRQRTVRTRRAVAFGLVGAAAGIVAGTALSRSTDGPQGQDQNGLRALRGMVGGGLGLLGGAAIGASWGDRWVPARLPGGAAP